MHPIRFGICVLLAVIWCAPGVSGGATGTATAPTTRPAKYTPATPEQALSTQKWAASQQEKVEEELKIKLACLETAHYQIFTDWDPREYTFLKENFEAAYAAVSDQFTIPAKENIFLGKLPCFVFVTYDAFAKFSKMSKAGPTSPDVQGYYMGNERGFGFMAMHKPQEDHGGRTLDSAMYLWKYVLTHEMTHAFVARYISNVDVAVWVNEGIAEVIASNRFPRDVHLRAQEAANKYHTLDKLFAENFTNPSTDMYPVMRTLVEVLIKKDRKAFIQFFDDMKRGKSSADALKDNYHWTYPQLEAVWRQYVK